MITSEQKDLIRVSFEALLPQGEALAAAFYTRLFEIDPSLRPLFKISLVDQQHKLIDMLAVTVHGLDSPNQLDSALHLLGERHVHYGVVAEQYAKVEEALLYALEQFIGEGFTPTMRAAWESIYQLMSERMLGSKAAHQ